MTNEENLIQLQKDLEDQQQKQQEAGEIPAAQREELSQMTR